MTKTIKYIKEIRTVPKELKDKVKAYNKLRKLILTALKEKPKTIPEISDEIKIESDIVTYNLMSLRKFGKVEVDSIDDMDEFFYYKLKK